MEASAIDGSGRRPRIVVLASGSGTNLQALLDASAPGPAGVPGLAGDVVGVVSDRVGARALDRAIAAGVRAIALSPEPREPRRRYDARLAAVVVELAPDLVVLAGFMRLLSSEFLDSFPGAVINLHPSLPGELPGTRAIERAHAEHLTGSRTATGVMVHRVPDEGIDDGPVLAHEVVPIIDGEPLDALASRIHAVEHRLLVAVVDDLCRSLAAAAGP
jgi:formyltetrahydrofolate-dependent phosphoribosylglycinamide formyltransferase